MLFKHFTLTLREFKIILKIQKLNIKKHSPLNLKKFINNYSKNSSLFSFINVRIKTYANNNIDKAKIPIHDNLFNFKISGGAEFKLLVNSKIAANNPNILENIKNTKSIKECVSRFNIYWRFNFELVIT